MPKGSRREAGSAATTCFRHERHHQPAAPIDLHRKLKLLLYILSIHFPVVWSYIQKILMQQAQHNRNIDEFLAADEQYARSFFCQCARLPSVPPEDDLLF